MLPKRYGIMAGGKRGIYESIGSDNARPPVTRRFIGKYIINSAKRITSQNILRLVTFIDSEFYHIRRELIESHRIRGYLSWLQPLR